MKIKSVFFALICVSVLMTMAVLTAVAILSISSGNRYGIKTVAENAIIKAESKELASDVKKTDFIFTALGIKWSTNEDINLYLKAREKNKWTPWTQVGQEQDNKYENEGNSGFMTTNSADAFQYKIERKNKKSDGQIIADMEITYINARNPIPKKLYAETARADNKLKIISRAEWGADESVRIWDPSRPKPDIKSIDSDYADKFSDELKIVRKVTTNSAGQELTWSLEYPVKATKVIIHHTDSVKDLDNPAQAVRNIYLWHTLGRGWGDIGYNYLIDPKGNIYEGRYGGEGVVGAHAGKANTGSIGIALMGDYENNDVPEAALNSLERLIAEKSAIHKINPIGHSEFRGQTLPNIVGHRDVMATACPGKYLYAKLEIIKKLSKQTPETTFEKTFFRIQKKQGYDYEDLSGIYYISTDPGKTKQITIRIKNTGTVLWPSGTQLIIGGTNAFADKLDIKTDKISATVSPGQIAAFNMTISSKYKEGLVELNIAPMVGGKTKLEKYIQIPINIAPSIYSYEVVGSNLPSGTVKSGAVLTGWIDLKNTGNAPWYKTGDNTVHLGTENPRDRLSLFTGTPSARIGFLNRKKVNPGEIGRFLFNFRAPQEADEYTEYFAPVVEGVRWMESKNLNFKVFVYNYPYNYKIYGVSAPNTFVASESKTVWIKLRNTGSVIWTQTGTNKLTISPLASQFKIKSYKLVENSVAPGAIGTIELTLIAPQKTGEYDFRFKAKIGGALLTRIPISISGAVQTTQQISASATKQSTQKSIKIALSFNGNPIITANGSFKLMSNGQILRTFKSNDEVSVEFKNFRYYIASKDYSAALNTPPRFEPISEAILEIKNYEKRPSWNTNLNDNKFRGTLEVIYHKNALRVINELAVEDYLKGLAENTNSDPFEKIKAIIVAARTYAFYYATVAQKFPGAPYDLDDDPSSTQKYLGYGYEIRAPNAVKAVNETADVVITYGGEPIKAAYFSSSDGRTRSYKEVWGSDVSYLQSVPDPYCKNQVLSGHGVGLSGCGATGMAQAGKTAENIIKYYYQGVEVKKIY